MNKLTKAVAAASLALLPLAPAMAQDTGSAGSQDSAQMKMPVGPDEVLATVNGQDITMGHVIATRQALPEQYQALPDEVLLEGILEQLIQQTVLSQAAGELSAKAQLQLENERRALIAGEKIDAISAEAVTDEALQAAYEKMYAGVDPEVEYNASHILVETEDEAKALIAQLNDGADFAELAKEYSTGPSGPNGGALGWFSEGMMVAPFEEAVKGLEVGQISGPVQTQFGWHVVKLNDKRAKAVPTLEEVRADLVKQVENDALEKALAALMEGADITRADLAKIDPASLRNDAMLVE